MKFVKIDGLDFIVYAGFFFTTRPSINKRGHGSYLRRRPGPCSKTLFCGSVAYYNLKPSFFGIGLKNLSRIPSDFLTSLDDDVDAGVL